MAKIWQRRSLPLLTKVKGMGQSQLFLQGICLAFMYVTSTAYSHSVISKSSLGNQPVSGKGVDGKNPSNMRRQELRQRMQCGQLSVASDSNGFHEEMGSQKMANHLILKSKKKDAFGNDTDIYNIPSTAPQSKFYMQADS